MLAQKQIVISGIVRDPRGNPVAQARVYFTDGPVPLPDIAALTDTGGTFSLSVPSPGTYSIGCAAEGYAPQKVTVTIAGEQEMQLEIRLKK